MGSAKIRNISQIETNEDEMEYSNIVSELLDGHKHVVTSLAKAFHEVKGVIPVSEFSELH